MAVEIEFVNVIVRKASLAAKYPGGLDAFVSTDLPNYIEDDHLVRVGYMSTREAWDLSDRLSRYGLSCDGTQADIVVVQRDASPGWLTIGHLENSTACWLAETDPGALVKCSHGFILRCPRTLLNQLETVFEAMGVFVSRSAPDSKERDMFVEVLQFSRDDACLTANVIGEESGNAPVRLWVSRDLTRRQHCADDVRFTEEIKAMLLEQGAEDG